MFLDNGISDVAAKPFNCSICSICRKLKPSTFSRFSIPKPPLTAVPPIELIVPDQVVMLPIWLINCLSSKKSFVPIFEKSIAWIRRTAFCRKRCLPSFCMRKNSRIFELLYVFLSFRFIYIFSRLYLCLLQLRSYRLLSEADAYQVLLHKNLQMLFLYSKSLPLSVLFTVAALGRSSLTSLCNIVLTFH